MPRTTGIVARTDRKEALQLASQLTDRFEREGFKVLLEQSLAQKTGHAEASTPLDKMKTDLIVTIGGDGTILKTCLRIPKPEPPILAIDMGVRGFLTEAPSENAFEAVEKYLAGAYHIEHCSKIASFVNDTRLPDALNEVFVTSRYLAKLLHLRIRKDGADVTECRADGVIIATQVGSTGYSFSSGGPILDPGLDAFVLTPVCPLTFLRPLVFSASSALTLDLLRPRAATVVIDGDFQREIDEKKPSVLIKKSEHESLFIRFEDNFYHRLKARLLFSREEDNQKWADVKP